MVADEEGKDSAPAAELLHLSKMSRILIEWQSRSVPRPRAKQSLVAGRRRRRSRAREAFRQTPLTPELLPPGSLGWPRQFRPMAVLCSPPTRIRWEEIGS